MGLSAACVMGVAGCSSNNQNSGSGAVAATINGTEIYEDTVTDYIQSVREQQGLTDEDSWGNYLAQMGTDPAGVREQIINTYVTRELINSGAEEKGVTVDSSEVDSYVDKMKSNYDSDEKWQSALEQAGMTEDEYRSENLELQLKAKELYNTFTSSEEPSNDDMLQYAQMYASAYDGAKRSSHILFDSDDEATAQDVLEQDQLLASSTSPRLPSSTPRTRVPRTLDGDVGWDKTSSFVHGVHGCAERPRKRPGQRFGYQQLRHPHHQVHRRVQRSEGEGRRRHRDGEDHQPRPDPLRVAGRRIKQSLQSQGQTTNYQNWLTEKKESSDLKINDMPSGLPYDVDMSKYQTEDPNSTDSADTNVSAADSTDGDASASTNGSADSSASAADAEGKSSAN